MIQLVSEDATFTVEILAPHLEWHALHLSPVDFYVSTDTAKYCGTAFTLESISALMDRYAASGECGHGLYFWASNLIVLKDFELETFQTTGRELISTGELSQALSQLTE
ncbi:hypothetical protein LAJ19_20740 (plasmid) [Deinococcus taeanensis]|uniref:hypothetical protein n=1 Tax=Deinococcus taeanensis TaxID=2737050 RepID=UPI001CDBDD3A|nr:hypothetical protein [Deinococcus taeanensis]UBV45230.1 hypothetical protein LAJ19_20740 [Deinococcus taeanensis]